MITNPRDLAGAAKQLSDSLKQGEKFPLPLLAVRAKKAALENPNDQPIRLLANVFAKMSENGKIFITRGEFNNICEKFASSGNTSLSNYFTNELDVTEEKPQRKLAGEAAKEMDDLYFGADQPLANALAELWDESGRIKKVGEYKLFDPKVANQAMRIASMELGRIGVSPKIMDVFAGTEKFIVCDASYETPKGEAHLLVPVEISKSGALIPTFFVTKHGFGNLDKNSINEHIISSAGKNLAINSDALLNALSVAKEASMMTDFQIKVLAMQDRLSHNQMLKTAASADKNLAPVFASNQILMQEVDSNKVENVMLEMPRAAEYEKFANVLTSSKGVAEFIFGKSTVESGKISIASKMASFGYNPQISVLSCDKDDDTITYAVKIDAMSGPIGFQVMAEVVNHKVVIPSIVAVCDKAYDFSKEGINSAIKSNNITDYGTLAAVSPMYELKSTEILENIRKAADQGDYETAEEALTVLAEKADAETYNKGLAEYIRSVNADSNPQLKKQAAVKSGCKMIVKSSSHSCAICGHLNLPLDKIYQNAHGECVPLYRKNMSETYEGAFFNTSKIFG